MNEKPIVETVIKCMLAMQRYPWEQGVCAQSLYEAGYDDLWIPMAYDSIKRMSEDGRLAMIGGEVAVSDPASCGEVCIRAYEKTGNTFFCDGADALLEYLMKKAPRTSDGIICHNYVSFADGFSPDQLWIDGLYMVPPFLAVMGELDEALYQINGYIYHLYDKEANLFYHIKDVDQNRYVRKMHWATGNGWALMGLARVIEEAKKNQREDISGSLLTILVSCLNSMLKYRLPDGRFMDILDEKGSFTDGTSAMMMSAVIYRGLLKGYLGADNNIIETGSTGSSDNPVVIDYESCADLAFETVTEKIDKYGLIYEVSGCPHFVSQGTSAEAQAAYVMASAWRKQLKESRGNNSAILSGGNHTIQP